MHAYTYIHTYVHVYIYIYTYINREGERGRERERERERAVASLWCGRRLLSRGISQPVNRRVTGNHTHRTRRMHAAVTEVVGRAPSLHPRTGNWPVFS